VGGICAGLGLSPDKIDMVMGVTKAYTTRVGGGPFPTEIHDKWGEYLREQGSEYGASTGRPRRCGWLDAVALEYACRLNGVKKIVLTKADVLDGVKEIKVCVGYKYKGEKLPSFPGENRILGQVEPVYKSISGWENPVCGSQDLADHQGAFLDYCHLIEDLLEVEVSIISTGANRHETILVEKALSGLVNLEKVRMDL
jgi:adenylosuccinate synthase